MTRTTPRRLTITAVAVGLLLAGSTAFAGQGNRQGREGAPGRGIRAALAAIDLTPEQNVRVRELLAAERSRLEPLRLEGRALREALRASAEAPNADPSAVGAAFLRVQTHRKAARLERESSKERLESILTPEQRAKLDGWREAHRQMRREGPGGRERGPGRRGVRPPVD